MIETHYAIASRHYYAKPLSSSGLLVTSPWGGDAIALTERSSGVYLLDRDPNTAYEIYERIGSEPASSDPVDAFLGVATATAAAVEEVRVAVEGIELPTLSGPFTRTITVTDSVTSAPIEGARVRLFRSGESETKLTNSGGVVTFATEAATWNYAITATGYTGASGTIQISADGNTAVGMVANVVVNQAEAPACNVLLPVLDQYLAPAPDVLVCIEFLSFLPTATRTAVIVNHPPSIRSDGEGVVEVTLARLARYRATYQIPGESPKRIEFSTPDAGSFIVVEA